MRRMPTTTGTRHVYIYKRIQGGAGDGRGWPCRLKYTARGPLIYIHVYARIINVIVARPCTNRFSGARRHNCVARSAGRRPRRGIYFHYFLFRAHRSQLLPPRPPDAGTCPGEVSRGYSRPVSPRTRPAAKKNVAPRTEPVPRNAYT